MKKPQSTYPLRLPRSVKAEVERRAKADGISVNQFVATAVSAAMNTAAFFAERRERADFTAFDRLMRRKCGEAPRPEDKISRGDRWIKRSHQFWHTPGPPPFSSINSHRAALVRLRLQRGSPHSPHTSQFRC